MPEPETFGIVVVSVAGFFFVAGIAAVVAVQARRRGYSFFVWLLAGMIALNPVIFLVALALMPNMARKRLREQFRVELAAKLAARSGSGLAPAAGPLPSLTASTLSPERSLGDLPTIAPVERSLGDEETRG